MDELQNIIMELDRILLTNLNIKKTDSNRNVFDSLTDYFNIEQNTEKNLIIFNGSVKLTNISFNLKDTVSFITENALALGMSIESLSAWKVILLIACDMLNVFSKTIIKLDNDMVVLVETLHNANAYNGIDKKLFYSKLSNLYTNAKVDAILLKLSNAKIIKEDNGSIYLKERFIATKK